MAHSIIRTLAFSLLVLAGGSPAFGQVALADRPYRGLFGGGHDLASRQTLDLSLQLGEAYDDDVLADTGGQVTPGGRQDSGYYTNLVASGNYGWKGTRVHVAANSASTLRQYNGASGVRVIGSTAGVGFTALMARRTRLFVNQSAAYSPSYLYGLFPSLALPEPGDQISASPDYRVDVSDSFSYGTSAVLSHGLTPRNNISAGVDYSRTDVTRETASLRDTSTYGVRGDFSRSVTRRTVLRAGYRYRRGDVGFGVSQASEPTVEHGIDLGWDYSKALSATRSAVFGFSLGTSAVNLAEGANLAVTGRLYRVVGGASFGYQFGRSWQARATFRRGLDYVTELAEPVFSDGFAAVLDGLFTSRLSFSVSSGYSSGQSALYTNTATFDTYTGNVKVRYAVSQLWAVNVDYLYYYYDFRGRPQMLPGRPPALERNGLRAGVTLWLPAFRK